MGCAMASEMQCCSGLLCWTRKTAGGNGKAIATAMWHWASFLQAPVRSGKMGEHIDMGET